MPDPATATTADDLAVAHPERIEVTASLAAELEQRIASEVAADRTTKHAVQEGETFVAAIDGGCPPQFHPGVPAAEAEVLAGLRERLGLDRATEVVLAADVEAAHARLLRAIGVEPAA